MVILLVTSTLLACAGAPSAAGPTPAKGRGLLVVAADGSGAYRSVQAAIDAVPANNTEPVTIHIKPGTYHERVEIPRDKPRVRLQGEEAARTVLTFNLHAKALGLDGRPLGTSRTSSTTVRANDFSAENLTFANATPRGVAQALALAARGDRQVFRRCRFVGWQDTLYLGEGRQYFEGCTIEGGVDFIFGPGTAVFLDCDIHSKQRGYVTAASTPQNVPYGFVFQRCRLTASAEVAARSVYLGRPWRDHASVYFLHSALGPHIRSEGWHNWNKVERERTARYGECGSSGPGAAPVARVAWARQLTAEETRAITVQAVLRGRDGWDVATQAGKGVAR
jgi:pectinesterase